MSSKSFVTNTTGVSLVSNLKLNLHILFGKVTTLVG